MPSAGPGFRAKNLSQHPPRPLVTSPFPNTESRKSECATHFLHVMLILTIMFMKCRLLFKKTKKQTEDVTSKKVGRIYEFFVIIMWLSVSQKLKKVSL